MGFRGSSVDSIWSTFFALKAFLYFTFFAKMFNAEFEPFDYNYISVQNTSTVDTGTILRKINNYLTGGEHPKAKHTSDAREEQQR